MLNSTMLESHLLPVLNDELCGMALRKTVLDRGRARVEEILAAHQPRGLDPAVEKELESYLQMPRERSYEDYLAYEDESRQDFSAL